MFDRQAYLPIEGELTITLREAHKSESDCWKVTYKGKEETRKGKQNGPWGSLPRDGESVKPLGMTRDLPRDGSGDFL